MAGEQKDGGIFTILGLIYGEGGMEGINRILEHGEEQRQYILAGCGVIVGEVNDDSNNRT